MPAAGAATSGMPGGDALDLKVCMTLLKKTIVLFPLMIMVVIVWVKVTLTYEADDEGYNNATYVVVSDGGGAAGGGGTANVSGAAVAASNATATSLLAKALLNATVT